MCMMGATLAMECEKANVNDIYGGLSVDSYFCNIVKMS